MPPFSARLIADVASIDPDQRTGASASRAASHVVARRLGPCGSGVGAMEVDGPSMPSPSPPPPSPVLPVPTVERASTSSEACPPVRREGARSERSLPMNTPARVGASNPEYNESFSEHAPQLSTSGCTKTIILSLIALISLCINCLTVWSILSNKKRKHSYTAINFLIIQLSIADLFVTVFCIGGEALWSYTISWPWGNTACKAFKFFQMFSLYLSTFILVFIGIDRFIVVKYPIKNIKSDLRYPQIIASIWIFSLILSIPQVVIFHVAQGPFVEKFSQCVTYGFYTESWQEQLYTTLSLIFMFILPLLILITSYVSTVITIARSERVFKSKIMYNHTINNRGDLSRERLLQRAKIKSLRISVVIVIVFLLWWAPYYIMMIIFMFLDPDRDNIILIFNSMK
ncbi:gonadotropin-releasing hormone receptor [Phymastichus coffea]|uniref:gonadotropin-releasing hormone receptor n=1 Tax=Phymastichus coffea TaxID=108790 RepID=UPI00273C0EAE|nr:gonadotropin-releasing hormone receptor [Phymastichus coffea]